MAHQERRSRIGVLGGTFDPPHLGHLAAASHAHYALGLDRVLFVPAGQQWQKAHRSVTSAEHRVAMTRLAIQDDPRFALSLVDVDRAGPTYTLDTVADLQRGMAQDADLLLLVGADALASLASWHRVDELLAQVEVVGLSRPGHRATEPGIPGREVSFLEIPGVEISSTQCRERFAANVPNKYLVPDSVIDYAVSHRLYGGGR